MPLFKGNKHPDAKSTADSTKLTVNLQGVWHWIRSSLHVHTYTPSTWCTRRLGSVHWKQREDPPRLSIHIASAERRCFASWPPRRSLTHTHNELHSLLKTENAFRVDWNSIQHVSSIPPSLPLHCLCIWNPTSLGKKAAKLRSKHLKDVLYFRRQLLIDVSGSEWSLRAAGILLHLFFFF